MRSLQIFEYPRIAQRTRAKSADCADPATAHNTSMDAKHSHCMLILSRGDMVRYEVGVCVCVRGRVHVCLHVRAVCVCSESMKDVTDNAKHNFGDPLDAKYIACARSVFENVGMLLKNSYIISDNCDLLSFLSNAFVPR